MLLAGLGVTELSMAPPLIAEVKAALRQVSLSDARSAAGDALRRARRQVGTSARIKPAARVRSFAAWRPAH